MENVSWIDRVRNGVLQRGKEQRDIVQTANGRKVNWIGHMLCRNCPLKHFTEGKIERRAKRREIIHWQMADDLKETTK
jgi:cytidylate kinase